MLSSKRSVRAGVVVVVGAVFLLLGLAPLAWAGESATPQETLVVVKTNAAGTLSAVKTNVPLTVAAFKATAESVRSSLRATGTAFKLTAPALLANLRATGTAAKATLSAGATNINATVIAVKTNVATQLAPLTDSKTAIEYYATNVLGTTVIVSEAHQATASEARNLAQSEAGAQIQKQVQALAAVTHYGKLTNGYATVSYGLGIAGDEKLDGALVAGSVAVYSLNLENVGPLDANSALALAQATFPKTAAFTYVPWVTKKGFAWLATQAEGVADTRTAKGGAGWILLYVLPGSGGKARVSATVVVGGFLPLTPR